MYTSYLPNSHDNVKIHTCTRLRRRAHVHTCTIAHTHTHNLTTHTYTHTPHTLNIAHMSNKALTHTQSLSFSLSVTHFLIFACIYWLADFCILVCVRCWEIGRLFSLPRLPRHTNDVLKAERLLIGSWRRWERERVCVCMCVSGEWVREIVCVYVWDRERGREMYSRYCVCIFVLFVLCVYVCMCVCIFVSTPWYMGVNLVNR